MIEYSQPIAELNDLELTVANRDIMLRMKTIVDTYAVPWFSWLRDGWDGFAILSIVDLGISADDDDGFDSSPLPAVPEQGHSDPLRAGGDEPSPDDRVVSAPSDGSVMVEGVKIDITCPLRVIRTACDTLGWSTPRGSKKFNTQRLQNFVKTQELMGAHSVSMDETQLKSESQREVHVQKRPVKPTKQQVEKHNLTHEPFGERWCELCVSFRSRQNERSPTDDSQSPTSLISFDFGFCGRSAESTEKVHDTDTGLRGAAPTLLKGGKHFQYLVSELTRFIVSTGHESVRLVMVNHPLWLCFKLHARRADR